MKVCGIELKGADARLVILEGTKESYQVLDIKPAKISLADEANQEESKAFRNTIHSYFRENGVEAVAVKKRAKKGDYAGGPVTFKLEGIIQLYDQCEVSLVAPQTIKAALRKNNAEPAAHLNRYQHDAFFAGFAVLP